MRKHAVEFGNPLPDEPLMFLKPATRRSLGRESSIVLPKGAGQVDYEGEIGVRVGKLRQGRRRREDAWDYVDGLCAP